jgi:hypothetical protein
MEPETYDGSRNLVFIRFIKDFAPYRKDDIANLPWSEGGDYVISGVAEVLEGIDE